MLVGLSLPDSRFEFLGVVLELEALFVPGVVVIVDQASLAVYIDQFTY